MLLIVKLFYKDITINFLTQIFLLPYLCPVQIDRTEKNSFKITNKIKFNLL
ncbi:hypothetical protein SAMN05660477_02008 [Soonwooa buanensis]|uniref:Uncharacterized protein n=1 Tax=Soonwooa buanensis TaxID=619805 RepID=A0A1T5FF39_9FLAO|nr:hypothetical protein SAMN05660477_02008 [Soonwooa buanensis]